MKLHASEITGSLEISGSITPDGSGSWDLGTANNPWKDLHVMSSSIHIYDTTGPIAKMGAIRGKGFEFKDHTGALTRITGSHMKMSGDAKVVGTVTAGEFSGGGAGITGVTAEWDGTHTGNGVITGNFDVSGNISGSATSTGSFGRVEASNFSAYNGPNNDLTMQMNDLLVDSDGGITLQTGDSGMVQISDTVLLKPSIEFKDDSDNVLGFLGDSFYYTGGNFGIGTNSPSHALHISGSGTTKLFVEGDISGSAASTGSFGDGRFVNKVGIGTTSPSSYYGIANDLVIGGGKANSGLTIATNDASSGEANITFSDAANASQEGRIEYKFRDGADTMTFMENEGVTMVLKNQKVGIGTGSPTGKLHVQRSALSGFDSHDDDDIILERTGAATVINIANDTTGYLMFSDATRHMGSIAYHHSGNSMAFRVNSATALEIDSSQNTTFSGKQVHIESGTSSVNLKLMGYGFVGCTESWHAPHIGFNSMATIGTGTAWSIANSHGTAGYADMRFLGYDQGIYFRAKDGAVTAGTNISDTTDLVLQLKPTKEAIFSGNVSLNKDDGTIYLNNAGTGNSGVYIRGNSDDSMRCLVPAGKFFEWEVGGVQKLLLNSSGNATFAGKANIDSAMQITDGASICGGVYTEETVLGSGTSRDISIFAEGTTNGGDIHFMTGGSGFHTLTLDASNNATFLADITAVDGTFTGDVIISNGSVSSPSINFANHSNTGIYMGASTSLRLAQGGVDALVIDSSQNATFGGDVGLDVTPHTQSSSFSALRIGGNAYLTGHTAVAVNGHINLSQNAYMTTDGTWTYISTDEATLYQQTYGKHTFYTAASDTGDITFSTVLTLDADQNATFAGTINSGAITATGNSNIDYLVVGNNQTTTRLLVDAAGYSAFEFGGDTTGGFCYNNTTSRNMAFGVNRQDDLVISNGGNVVIRGTLGSGAITSTAGLSGTTGTFTGTVNINRANDSAAHISLGQSEGSGVTYNILSDDAGNFTIREAADTRFTINTSGNATFAGDLTVTGGLTINGTTTTVSTTNMVVSDNMIELNNGASSNANDSGLVIERGSTGDNAIFVWDESADGFIVGTTTATGASTGNLTITAAPLQTAAFTATTGTFAGKITVNETVTEILQLNTTNANGGFVTLKNSGTTYGYIGSAKSLVSSGNDINDLTIRSENELYLVAGGSGQDVKIDTDGSATFAGTLNSGAITSTAGLGGTTGQFSSTVGIRQTSPSVDLHIGDAATGVDAILRLESGGGSKASKILLTDEGSSAWEIRKAGTSQNLEFYGYGSSTNVLLLDTSGNATFAGTITATGISHFKRASTSTSDPTNNIVLQLQNTSDTDNAFNTLMFKDAQENDGAYISAKHTDHSGNKASLHFGVRNGSSCFETLNFSSAGNATFAGDIEMTGTRKLKATNDLQLYADNTLMADFWLSGADEYVHFKGTTRTTDKFDQTGTAENTFGGGAKFANHVTTSGTYSFRSYGVGTHGVTNTEALELFADSNGGHIEHVAAGTGTSRSLLFKTGGSTALTLDTSQNATFAGNVQIDNSDNGYILLGDHASYRANIDYYSGGDTIFSLANTFNNTNAKFEIRMGGNATGNAKLTIDGSGNATFAGKLYANDDIWTRDTGSNSSLRMQSTDGVGTINVGKNGSVATTFNLQVQNSAGSVVTPLAINTSQDITATVGSIFRVSAAGGVKININAGGTASSWLEFEKAGVDQWLVGTESSETDFQWYWSPSSAGTKMRLTNAGNLTVAGNITTPKVIATGSSGIGIGLQTDNVALALGAGTDFKMWHDGNTNLWNYVGGGSLKFGTNNALALTLDTSQNATFAGQIIASTKVSIGHSGTGGPALGVTGHIGVSGGVRIGSNSATNSGGGELQLLVGSGDGDFRVNQWNGSAWVDALYITGSTSNATFAGDVYMTKATSTLWIKSTTTATQAKISLEAGGGNNCYLAVEGTTPGMGGGTASGDFVAYRGGHLWKANLTTFTTGAAFVSTGTGTFGGDVTVEDTSASIKLMESGDNAYYVTLSSYHNAGDTFALYGYKGDYLKHIRTDDADEDTHTLRIGGAMKRVDIWSNGSQRLLIDETGKVGIGTTTPGGRLDLGAGYMVNEQGRQDHVANTMSSPYYWFDGDTDKVSIGNTSTMPMGKGDYSIEGLVRFNNATNGMVILGDSDANANNFVRLMLWGEDSAVGKLRFDGHTASPNQYNWIISTPENVVSAGKWHHIVAVLDRDTAANCGIWVDGVKVSDTVSNLDSGANSHDFDNINIGIDYAGNYDFDGQIAKVRAFNHALTDTEVKEFYSGASVPFKYKGANQTSMNTVLADNYGTFDNFSGASATGYTASNSSATGTKFITLRLTGFTLTKGKYVAFTINHSTFANVTVSYWKIGETAGGGNSYTNMQTGVGSGVSTTYNLVIMDSIANPFLRIVYSTAADTSIVASDIKLVQMGAVAEYDGSGATGDKWYDKSGNNLDGTVSGASLENMATGVNIGGPFIFDLGHGYTNNSIKWANGQEIYYTGNGGLGLKAGSAYLRLESNEFYMTGGNVGIGTSAPSTTLSIVGDDGLENINTKHSNLTAGIAIGYSGIKSTGTNTNNDITIDAKGSGDISLQTNATGNVGIGTNAPTNPLEIAIGAADESLRLSCFSATDGHAGALMLSKSSSTTIGTRTATAAGETLGAIVAQGVDSDNDLRGSSMIKFQGDAAPNGGSVPGRILFMTSDTNAYGNIHERMRIDDSGKVGIGTTDPNGVLHLQDSSGTAYFRMDSRVTDNSEGWYFKTSGTVSTTTLEIGNRWGSDTPRITALSSGNIGIGTTAPATLLHVGSATTTSNVAIRIDTQNSSTYTPALQFAWGGSVSAEIDFQFDTRATTGFKIGTTAATHPMSFVINDVTKMYIDGTGKVGIGTTGPASLLEVNNGDFIVSGSNQRIFVKEDGGNNSVELGHSTSTAYDGFLMLTNDSGTVQTLLTSGTGVSYINNGNVGIGTTSPLTELDVNGRFRSIVAGTDPSSGTGLEMYYDTSSTEGRIYAYDRSGSVWKDLKFGNAALIISGNKNATFAGDIIQVRSGVNAKLYLGETATHGYSFQYEYSGNRLEIRGHDGSASGQVFMHMSRDTGITTFTGAEYHFNAGSVSGAGNATFSGNISLTSGKNITSGNMKIYIDTGSHSTSADYATFESLSDRGVDIRSQSQIRFYVDNANTLAMTIADDKHVTLTQKLTISSDFRQTYGDAQFYSTLLVPGTLTSGGDILPSVDNSKDLGSTTKRWANLYVGDMQMNNEGTGGNEVDGTEGNWSLQEGEDDLFVINRKTGKKFKIKLEAM